MMTKSEKIGAVVVGVLVIIVLLWIILPNGNEGGNKSVYPVSDTHPSADHEDTSHADANAKEDSLSEMGAVSDVKNPLHYKLTFTAYKTSDKVAVNGSFDNITLTNLQEKDKLSEALTGSEFSIETNSVNTEDPTGLRDPKLKEFFFQNLASPVIVGTFNSFANGKANVTISMNGKSKDFNFDYTETENSLTMDGGIDMLSDFAADTAFNAIAEACKDLHANKTWTEVGIHIVFNK